MATLTERVIALAGDGMTFPVIAAILNVTAAQVEEAFLGVDLPQAGAALPEPRWLAFDISMNGTPAAGQLGLETSVPIFPADLWESAPYIYGAASTSVADVNAGGIVAGFNNVILQSARGGDTVTPGISGVIWQIGAAHNWCKFALDSPALTVAEIEHVFTHADVHIEAQAAADFSVGEGAATILSAAGGQFLATVQFGGTTAVLDP